jgi:16S rRNA (cytosine1402-N4)-methyltransferase
MTQAATMTAVPDVTGHQPVMEAEALAGLALKPAGRYVDATFGRGGHSRAILAGLGADGHLVAFDRDPEAVAVGQALAAADARFEIRYGNFEVIDAQLPAASFDGVLFDFGVSSPQLDQAERGFSFMRDGPLDMRMDPHSGISAAQWLANVSEAELARVLHEFGEEPQSRRLARAIVAWRGEHPFVRTLELADFVASVLPRRFDGIHPATRVFQAIRIAINDELEAIDRGLLAAQRLLAPHGRLVAISFHSLEDRRVKQYVQTRARPPQGSRRLPPAASTELSLRDLGKHKAGSVELARNPRSRSAVLRVAERLP